MAVDSLEGRLDLMAGLLSEVVQAQERDTDPAHEDFYLWGWALSDLTMRLQTVVRVLSGQVAHYGDDRILRDDEGDDWAGRLVEVTRYLDLLARELDQAKKTARRYHSAIGHIAVEVDPEATL